MKVAVLTLVALVTLGMMAPASAYVNPTITYYAASQAANSGGYSTDYNYTEALLERCGEMEETYKYRDCKDTYDGERELLSNIMLGVLFGFMVFVGFIIFKAWRS